MDLDAIRVARDALNALLEADGIAMPSYDDPMTAPLGPFGEWQPLWLKVKADLAAAKNPNGLSQSVEVGPDGRARAANVAWPSHFIWSGCLARTDLTEQQRTMPPTRRLGSRFTPSRAARGRRC
jgi:hypothetical protein